MRDISSSSKMSLSRIRIIHRKRSSEYFAKYTTKIFLSFFPKLLLFARLCRFILAVGGLKFSAILLM